MLMWWWYSRLDEQESKREATIKDLKRKIEMKNQIKNIYDLLEAMTNESKVKYLLNDYNNRNDAQQETLQEGDTAGDTDKKQV